MKRYRFQKLLEGVCKQRDEKHITFSQAFSKNVINEIQGYTGGSWCKLEASNGRRVTKYSASLVLMMFWSPSQRNFVKSYY